MSFKVSPIRSGSGGGSTPIVCPFDIAVSTNSDKSLTPKVRPGSVNGLIPGNLFQTFDSFQKTDVINVYVTCYSDGQSITSCELNIDSGQPNIQIPTPFGLPTTVDVFIGVIVGGVWYRGIGCGSIQLTGIQQFITNTPSPASPGTLNYIPYFAWQASTI